MSFIFGRRKRNSERSRHSGSAAGSGRSPRCVPLTPSTDRLQVARKEAVNSPRRPGDFGVFHCCQLDTMHCGDTLLSARGIRFKETVVSGRYGGSSRASSLAESPTPLTLCSPLTIFSFIVPARCEKLSYKERQQQLRAAMAGSPHFQDGLLLDTREKGVLFPVVHVTDNPEVVPAKLPGGEPDHTPLGDNFILYQGMYREVRNIVPETELPLVAPFPQAQENIGYILLGFKSLDRNFSQVMLDTWKDWTGARYIYMYLPDDLGLRKISFFHRQLPDDLNLFMYLVLVECHGITSREKQVRLLDFAQRMRLERMTGYISVYGGVRDGAGSPQSPQSPRSPLHIHELIEARKKSEISESLFSNGIVPRNTRV